MKVSRNIYKNIVLELLLLFVRNIQNGDEKCGQEPSHGGC